MKRILTVLLAFSLALSLTACGGTQESSDTTESEISSENTLVEESSAESEPESSLEESSAEESSETAESSESAAESSAETSKEESSAPAENSQADSTPVLKPETSKPAEKPTSSTPEESSEQAPPSATVIEEDSNAAPEGAYDRSTEIFNAIDAAFAEAYPDSGCVIPAMPMDMDKQYIADTLGISADLLVSGKGQQAGMMTNCDMLLVVEAAEGQFDVVKSAMDTALQARYDAFSWYGVMGNAERTEAAKVVSKGNFIALIMVGIMPEEGTPDFTSDVQLAEDTFYAAIE
ncbi:MAG: DUF4358 domain-containing protein [Candidatus Merdivicinus sp.]|jgi:hypothetical protein